MLARISRLPGVLSASVEPNGRTFALEMDDGADAERVVADALNLLGPNSYPLDAPWDSEELLYRPQGEIWFDRVSVRALSMLEARLLAARWSTAAASAAKLASRTGDRLAILLKRELMREFDRIHETGGAQDSIWYKRDFPAAFERVLSRLAPELSSEQQTIVAESLRTSLAG